MEQTSVMAKVAIKANNFYKTNWAFIFFMSTTTIFSLLQVILFALNLMPVNGQTQDEWKSLFEAWTLLSVSIIGTYCGFIGGIMLFRGSLSFMYWQNVATILAVITQLLSGMWFGAFTSFYFIGTNIFRYWMWKNNKIEEWAWSNKKVMTIGIIYLIVLLVITNTIALVFAKPMYFDVQPWMHQVNCNADATGASLNMAAALIMCFRVRWAFIIFATSKLFTIFNYGCAGLIVPIVQMMLFWVMDFTGFIGWSIPKVEHNPEYAVE